MSLQTKLLPTFNTVQAGSTAVVDLDLGKRYHVLWLQLSDDGTLSNGWAANTPTSAEIQTWLGAYGGAIRVKVNGKVQRTMFLSELNALNAINGAQFSCKTAGTKGTSGLTVYMPIYFAEPWRNNNAAVAAPAWNANGISSFQVELDILAAVSAPVVTGFYEFDAVTGPIGAISKWIRQSLGASGTIQDFNSITKADYLQSINLFAIDSTHCVNKLKFTLNNVEVVDLMTTVQNQVKLIGRGLYPDTSTYPRFDLVFDYDDPVTQWLNVNGANEMTLHVEYNANSAGTMVAIIQRVGNPE